MPDDNADAEAASQMDAQPASRPPLTIPAHGPRIPSEAHRAGFRAMLASNPNNPAIPLYWVPLAADFLRGVEDARKAQAERYPTK